MHVVGKLFGAADTVFDGLRRAARAVGRSFVDGPLREVGASLFLAVAFLWVLVEDLSKRFDRVACWVERALVLVAMLGMTALAFNEYLARELRPALGTDLGGLWALEGQMNMALLLMVVVGFVGASLATATGDHLKIDAIDRVVSPSAGRFVRRLVSVVAAGLCFEFTKGAWALVLEASHDSVPGLKVWGPLVAPVNAITSLLPGDKYGPNAATFESFGAAFADRGAWEDAMFDAGKEWDALGTAFRYVEAGDSFPLPVPLLILVVAFALMTLRFTAQALVPAPVDVVPSSATTRRVADISLAGGFPGALIAIGLAAWLGTPWMILITAVLLVLMGAPLFVAVGVGTLASWSLLRDGAPHTVVSDMFEATYKQELLAIPFFVLAGNLMTRGSIAQRLIDFARALLGPLPGGLGVGAVVSCALFAAISGSSPVTVIAIGTLLFPMLVKEGYPERYAMGVLTTAGGLGIIIPPSIPMIVYAIVVSALPDPDPATLSPDVAANLVSFSEVTPRSLFLAGFVPGAFIALVLAAYTLYQAWPRGSFQGYGGRASTEGYLGNTARAFGRGALSLFLPVLILGGIYGLFDLEPLGVPVSIVFSVTEAAAVAVVYALFVELVVHRELSLRDLPEIVADSAKMMGSLFLILVIAISLNRFFVFEQLPEAATAWMMQTVHSKVGFLIVVNLFLLALGCVMDILSAILIVAPLLAPIAQSYGIHPVHFGIMFIVNLELGYLTPPMGMNLFVASSVFERPILEVIRAVLPFLVVMLFCLFCIVAFPSMSLVFQ